MLKATLRYCSILVVLTTNILEIDYWAGLKYSQIFDKIISIKGIFIRFWCLNTADTVNWRLVPRFNKYKI